MMYYSDEYLCHYGVLGMKWGQHLMAKSYSKSDYKKRMSNNNYANRVKQLANINVTNAYQRSNGDSKKAIADTYAHLHDMQNTFQTSITKMDNKIISYGSNPLMVVSKKSAIKSVNSLMDGWTLTRDTEEYLNERSGK